jgi:hypothetical protein
MAIKIIETSEIRLTREQHSRYLAEYRQSTMMMVNPPDFETWVRGQLNENRQLLQE